ncbi:DUF3825 domain-containing protein [Sphingomonas piscis]|uniref:DUF3825 domain-containing protein n=1 Tax=Sphingomonas piscis TaxID=2714943 RepID=A0A6G7YNQ5_9SPHN|nr:DUF3825 domain-containing protein [Sphingomonas piscis]QIK78369.1 DUF3825 domain-containing protein [Sphingomonas piscis]
MFEVPTDLYEFAYIHAPDERLKQLAIMAEPEDWEPLEAPDRRPMAVLKSYIKYTFARLAEEGKVILSDDGAYYVFNTGLVTPNQEAIFALFDRNQNDGQQVWHFLKWCKRYDLVNFSELPGITHYFDDPSKLVLNMSKELRVNIDHIVSENKTRFPEPFNSMDDYTLQTFLKGAIDNAKERVCRNYKAAVPQYHRGKVQLLLPLCITNPAKADLALVVEDHGSFYRASTCLTLDMAYNNARLLARPDKDWLRPNEGRA